MLTRLTHNPSKKENTFQKNHKAPKVLKDFISAVQTHIMDIKIEPTYKETCLMMKKALKMLI